MTVKDEKDTAHQFHGIYYGRDLGARCLRVCPGPARCRAWSRGRARPSFNRSCCRRRRRPDRPPDLARPGEPPLPLRLVAVRQSEPAIAEARRAAQREGVQVSQATLIAAEWVILVTSLAAADYSAGDVLALYRLR